MAITTGLCTSFKAECLQGVHDFGSDTFKLALYTSDANLGPSTTEYTTDSEVENPVSPARYPAGGNEVTVSGISTSGTTAYVEFADVTWLTLNLTFRGALLYNSSKANRAVAVIDFGEDRTLAGGNLRINLSDGTAKRPVVGFF